MYSCESRSEYIWWEERKKDRCKDRCKDRYMYRLDIDAFIKLSIPHLIGSLAIPAKVWHLLPSWSLWKGWGRPKGLFGDCSRPTGPIPWAQCRGLVLWERWCFLKDGDGKNVQLQCSRRPGLFAWVCACACMFERVDLDKNYRIPSSRALLARWAQPLQ